MDMNIVTWALVSLFATSFSYLLGVRKSRQTQVDLEVALNEIKQLKVNSEAQVNSINEHQASIREQDLKLATLTSESESTSIRLAEIKSKKSTIEESLKQAEDLITQLKTDLSAIQAKHDNAVEDLEAKKKLISKLADELESVTNERNLMKENNVELVTQFEAKKEALVQSIAACKEGKDQISKLANDTIKKAQEISNLKSQLSKTEANLNAVSNQLNELKKDNRDITKNYENVLNERHDINERYVSLSQKLTSKEQHFQEQLQIIQDSKAELKKEFENLANEIFERKGNAFKKLNTESMSKILSPIHEELKGFKVKVEGIHVKETEQRTALRTELENLQKLNRDITEQANQLTTALRGQKKVQGNWGELMLENVLDNSGLRLGTDYKREASFSTEEGKLRPDVIVHLPQGKHLVIDAKTSLNAYTRYVNSDSAKERNIALSEHCNAIRSRLTELSSKDYWNLPGLNSPEVVIMFIPIESAYVEALKADETLFQLALEENILIATPTTLLTSLNIVRQLWRFEEQNKHTAELANRAQKFYEKLNSFLVSMQSVGSQLDKAKGTYDKALGQLYTGRGNLIKQASEFKDLGVSVKKSLPEPLVEQANLELAAPVIEEDNDRTQYVN
ncbi:DNA recombination protein RmuC [Vibrio alfacsensis]|uniref:DNA recombination protein RmuC n=1 Tax=Vibrio alfacsensis TaxID=1074311 RepID=UPI0040691A9F